MSQDMENRRRQVLIVDDEIVNRLMLGNILNSEYDVLYAGDGLEAMEILHAQSNRISCIMLDILMPRMDGREFLRQRRNDEKLCMIPVIVLTSEVGSEVETLDLGASDFLKKPYDDEKVILARVRRLVELTENRRIIQSTERDQLTGLYTKQYFYEYVTQQEYYSPGRLMDVVVLNIEKFHLVNEIYGRVYGDNVLRETASAIRQSIGDQGGIACRTDGDIFYIYLPHQEDYNSLRDRLQTSLDTQFPKARVRLRIGVCLMKPDEDIEIERRCDRAKSACDTVKDIYTSPVAFYDEDMQQKSLLSMRMISEVESAIEKRQLQAYFQPKFDITGPVPILCSAEALVRWNHPELGMISPGAFIPLFEKNGLIQKVDYHVWREAAAQVSAWKEEYGVSIPVSVNISRIDLYDPGLVDKLTGILKEFDLSYDEFYLEVTETAYVGDEKHIVDTIMSLQELGFHIEMDDFGSGFSSLGMLTSLPVDILKMDMKLVRDICRSRKNRYLVSSVIKLAHYMSMRVVAEGVEEKEQCDLLREEGCDVIQGWYFSKPLPADQFTRFIKEKKQAEGKG